MLQALEAPLKSVSVGGVHASGRRWGASPRTHAVLQLSPSVTSLRLLSRRKRRIPGADFGHVSEPTARPPA